MLNRQRELTLPRPTAAPTATSSAYILTLQLLWHSPQRWWELNGTQLYYLEEPGPLVSAREVGRLALGC